MAIRLTRASSQYLVRVPDDGAVIDYRQPYAFVATIRVVSDANDYGNIFSVGDLANGSLDYLELDVDGTTLHSGSYTFWTLSTVGSITLTPGVWYNVALVRYGAADCRMFCDAVQIGSAHTNNQSGGNPTTFMGIGSWNAASDFADIRIANAKIFNRSLTVAEIAAEHAKMQPASSTNLWAWYPAVSNSIAAARLDYSGNGRHWTAVGTPTIEDGPPIGWGGRIAIVGQAAASGTTYDDSLTESVTAADSLANSATFGPSLSESATVADSYATAATFESALTESVAANDALAAGQVMPEALAESATVADDYSATVSKDESLTESVTAADSVAAAQVFAETITESVAASDAYASAQTMGSAVSESATVSDDVAASQGFSDTLTESVTAADSYADEYVPKGTFDDTLTETVTASDSYAVTQVHVADVIELASVADGYAATGGTLLSSGQAPAGRPSRSKRRRVVIGERVYEVPERDIPALLEATLLDRMPPKTAEVVEGPKPRKRVKKAAVKTVEQVQEAVEQIKARIEPDNAWLAQALEAVAYRVLERLQDEEESIMLLVA